MLTMGSGPCPERTCHSYLPILRCFPYVYPWLVFPMTVTGIGVSGHYQFCWTFVNSILSSSLLKSTGMALMAVTPTRNPPP